jgi:hypothetical protein
MLTVPEALQATPVLSGEHTEPLDKQEIDESRNIEKTEHHHQLLVVVGRFVD